MPAVKTDVKHLEALAKRIRHHILTSTTSAGSGHPTSSLSAVELLTTVFFGGFLRMDALNFNHPNNDRFILSKGHAAPLLYSLYTAAGLISFDELHTLREFGSRLEGHPTREFPFTEVTTGSLGQGLSVGVGMAINAKYLDKLPYNTYVLLGDGEMAEGSNYEAMQVAAHYELDNLIAIVDINRMGQTGPTMLEHDLVAYQRRAQGFGWRTVTCDGHNVKEVVAAMNKAISRKYRRKPIMVLAKTLKGKGVPMIEDKPGWHGKALNEEQLASALLELGPVDLTVGGQFALPENKMPHTEARKPVEELDADYKKPFAPRKAYGHALTELAPHYPELVVLDAEVSNSTFAETFAKAYPDRFFEMFIAEQNMVGVAAGLSRRGKIPFVSSFGAFLTRAFDQIRQAQYSHLNINFVGSHVGVSIGEDGPTQMGLEDIAMFRTILNSTVVYPADHVATEKLVGQMIQHPGISYLRLTRHEGEPIYKPETPFVLGGSHTLKSSPQDDYTLVAAGVTVYEALAAHTELKKHGIITRVIDLYSIKPIDYQALYLAAQDTKGIFTIEDHYAEGGMGEAVRTSLYASTTPIYSLAVRNMPKSGSKDQLLDYEGISARAIVESVRGVKSTEK